MQERGKYEERERIEWQRVVSRGLTYVNVFPASAFAAPESRTDLGDSRKWAELVNLINIGEGSSGWIAQQHTAVTKHTQTHTNTANHI